MVHMNQYGVLLNKLQFDHIIYGSVQQLNLFVISLISSTHDSGLFPIQRILWSRVSLFLELFFSFFNNLL